MVGLAIPLRYQQIEDLKFDPRKSLVSSALAWPIIPTLIIWCRFLRYVSPPPPPLIKNPGYRPVMHTASVRLHTDQRIYETSQCYIASRVP